jgi:hypothetical protein
MTVRSDGYSVSAPKGTAHWTFGGSDLWLGGSYPIITERSVRQDTIHEPDNGPFFVDSYELKGGRINGRQPDTTVWTDYIADAYENPNIFGHHPKGDAPDNFAAATEGAKRTNPSRPLVDLPSEIAQLHEVPQLLRRVGRDKISQLDSGDSLGRKGAKAFVETKFGVNPYIDDVLKLCNFKEAVNHRTKELERAHSGNGLRRTVNVYKGTNTAEGDWAVQTNWGFYVVPSRWTTSEEVRVHCRWYPSATFWPFETNDAPLISQARRALLGGTIDMATAWELIPWTWLMDWCGSVGDYLMATRNTVNINLGSVSVMRHQRTEFWMGSSNMNGSAQVGPATVVKDTKNRTLSAVFPEAHWPFLNEGQLGIAASLTVLKSSDI